MFSFPSKKLFWPRDVIFVVSCVSVQISYIVRASRRSDYSLGVFDEKVGN